MTSSAFNVFAEAGSLPEDPEVDLQLTVGRGFYSAELTTEEARQIVDRLEDALEDAGEA